MNDFPAVVLFCFLLSSCKTTSAESTSTVETESAIAPAEAIAPDPLSTLFATGEVFRRKSDEGTLFHKGREVTVY